MRRRLRARGGRRRHGRRSGDPCHRGVALIEWLIAAPIAILVGLFVVQWALLWQARHAIEYATHVAARAAALDHGAANALEQGLAEGLGPFWGVEPAIAGRSRVASGLASGWLGWQRSWPSAKVFADFAEPALDANGEKIGGLAEVPNDNLRFRDRALGAKSGISIQDANRFGVRVVYGVPLVVPLVNVLAVRTMEIADGCTGSASFQLGPLSLGRGNRINADRDWACAIYRAPDAPGGAARWRWPVRVVSEVRMHSPLRDGTGERGAATGAKSP